MKNKEVNYKRQGREMFIMAINENRNVEIDRNTVEKRMDSSQVASTFIKYAAYVVIFFGALYFLVRYVFPMF
ncbi:hypothetical protein ACI5FR_27110 [Paenibacillus sp. HJGM_3]